MFRKDCKNCGKPLRGQEDYCPLCEQIKSDRDWQSQALANSFTGSGRKGFIQLLHKGKFMRILHGDDDRTLYNDRIEIIQALAGSTEEMEKLIQAVGKFIIEYVSTERRKKEDG
jgi:hypothetical protein